MKVLIVSGFLGAGKTTFIKELIRRTKKSVVILENEYGGSDLDKRELSSVSGVDVLDFAEGCVCCSMKEGFANSVMTVASALNPDVLVVEPTGAALLSKVMANLSAIAYENIVLLPPIAIVSPRGFQQYLSGSSEIYEDQIESAARVIFSKCENENKDTLRKIKEKILEKNPTAEVTDSHYTLQDSIWWSTLLEKKEDGGFSGEAPKKAQLWRRSLRGVVYPVFSQQSTTVSLNKGWKPEETSFHGFDDIGLRGLIVFLDGAVRGRFGGIIRIKGVMKTKGEFISFEVAEGMYTLAGIEDYTGESQCVLIGYGIHRKAIAEIFVENFLY